MWYVKIKLEVVGEKRRDCYYILLSKKNTVTGWGKCLEIGQAEQRHFGFCSICNAKSSWENNISKQLQITEWQYVDSKVNILEKKMVKPKTPDDLKKGTMILLRNGWRAKLIENRKGQIRYAEVYGDVTESGSIYSHNIVGYFDAKGKMKRVSLTSMQKKCAELTGMFGL